LAYQLSIHPPAKAIFNLQALIYQWNYFRSTPGIIYPTRIAMILIGTLEFFHRQFYTFFAAALLFPPAWQEIKRAFEDFFVTSERPVTRKFPWEKMS
jgi:hypothetical protein